MTQFNLPSQLPNSYVAGTVVRCNASFVNAAGVATDPTTVTATAQYAGPAGGVPLAPPVTQAVVRDSAGAYHCEVATAGWTGPGRQQVTVFWQGTGALTAAFEDTFYVTPTLSGATDVAGP